MNWKAAAALILLLLAALAALFLFWLALPEQEPALLMRPTAPSPAATLPSALPAWTGTPSPRPALSATRTSSSTPAPLPTATQVASSLALPIYIDQLAPGWLDWSWNTGRNLSSSSPVQAGSAAAAITYTGAWGGFKLHFDQGINTSRYDQLVFWVHGGTAGGQKILLVANNDNAIAYGFTAPRGAWQQVVVPIEKLGSPALLKDLTWQEISGSPQPVFYLDEISLSSSGRPTVTPSVTPTPATFTLKIDAAAGLRPISPEIYGMNFADEALAKELRLPLDRYGGNATTRYNWKNDTSNRASDWFFENIPNTNPNPAALPVCSASDQFIEKDRRAGAASLLTIPLIGWTPKSRAITCAFSVSLYGPQQKTDPYRPDCGNGLRPDGSKITGNQPGDTSSAIGPDFVQEWLRYLVGRFGTAGSGGVRYYNLDNEPMLWNSTHRDVHPNPVSYDEIRDLTYQYAAAIKAVDPAAKTLGPVLWGWTAYFYSALDTAAGDRWWNLPQDRLAHGNTPFVEWYLQQMRAYEQAHGQRILDYLDLHYYPQAGNALTSAGSAELRAKRLRSTRSLWDPRYVDESWIPEPVRLIPRMRAWVEANYPGTRLAISEYNFGGLEDLNGALTQADVLGIFGREGLDLAALWDPPKADQPGAFAFRIYRNYDGAGGAFGETSLQAVSMDQDRLSVYAARRAADGALTVVIINKTANPQNGALSLANFLPSSSAQVYRYSAADLNHIQRLPPQPVSAGAVTALYPANSITLLIIPPQ